jgi:hypothetical protein
MRLSPELDSKVSPRVTAISGGGIVESYRMAACFIWLPGATTHGSP